MNTLLTAEATVVRLDPICRRPLSARTAGRTRRFAGTTYWFCSVECEERFVRERIGGLYDAIMAEARRRNGHLSTVSGRERSNIR